MNESVFDEKLSFNLQGWSFTSKLGWESYIVSIAETASKKIGVLIRYMKFFSSEVGLYFYKSRLRPYMEYCMRMCWVNYRNGYVGLLVVHSLLLFNPWLVVEM